MIELYIGYIYVCHYIELEHWGHITIKAHNLYELWCENRVGTVEPEGNEVRGAGQNVFEGYGKQPLQHKTPSLSWIVAETDRNIIIWLA